MSKAELEVIPGDSRDLLNEIRILIEDTRRQTAVAVNVRLTARSLRGLLARCSGPLPELIPDLPVADCRQAVATIELVALLRTATVG
jgi:hypothetical protein